MLIMDADNLCIKADKSLPPGRYQLSTQGIWNGDEWTTDFPTLIEVEHVKPVTNDGLSLTGLQWVLILFLFFLVWHHAYDFFKRLAQNKLYKALQTDDETTTKTTVVSED